jgi:hypothetical protein
VSRSGHGRNPAHAMRTIGQGAGYAVRLVYGIALACLAVTLR